jgi:hypothetical protein
VSGSIGLEKLGKPVVFVVTDNFIQDARSSAEDNGMPGLRMVTVPANEYYKRRVTREEVKPIVSNVLTALATALTRPLTIEEREPPTKKVEPGSTIKITGETYEAALEKFNQLFLDNHWGSGLPLIPPTPERVKWMLTGTSRSPTEVIGTVAPKNGIATVEKIAVNAVMAGAKPEYLPVIIATMAGLADKSFDLLHVMASTGSFTLQIVVSGPIAKEIGMHSGIGLLGYGWRANNTIGHALRLNLINLGHLWPGENDMALLGRPSSHNFYTFSENDANNPWEPHHVSRGFKQEESCVTVTTVGSYSTSFQGLTNLGGGAVSTWTIQSIMDATVRAINRGRRSMGEWRLGGHAPSPLRHYIFLHPEAAIEMNRLGYTRKSLQDYFYEKTSIPFEKLTQEEKTNLQRRIDAGEIPTDRLAVFKESLKPGGKVPLLLRPEDCYIIVAGGIPGYSFETSYYAIPPTGATAAMTKPVRDATLTKAGR